MSRSNGIRILLTIIVVALFSVGMPVLVWGQQNGTAAAEGKAPEAKDGETENKESLDLFSLLYRGGWVMIPIALASVLALTLTIERVISLRKKKIVPPHFIPGLQARFKEGKLNPEEGKTYCSQNPCVFGALVKAGIPKLAKGELPLQRAMEDAGAREVDRMKRSLKPLSMIAAVSPLLGLLGTVYGMIRAFQAASNAGMGKSDVLAQGIYEALVTTAAGLTVAIPVLIIYQLLSNKVDSMVDCLDDSAEEFLAFAVNNNKG